MQGIRVVVAVAMMLAALGSGIALAAEGDAGGGGESEVAAQGAPPVAPGPEIVSARTANSRTFRLPDGRREARIYAGPVNHRDGEGRWQPIGAGLREADEDTLANGANSFDLHLPKQLDAGPVRLSVGEHWVASELLGTDVGSVQLDGKTASYARATPGVAFEYRGTSSGLKEDIVLAGPAQPSRFAFELSASAGLVPSLGADGAVRFRDAEGRAIVTLPPPVMLDSAPRPAVSNAIRYELGPERDGRWRLELIAERDWLEDPERAFPVRLDPTMTVEPDLDCVIGGRSGETGWIYCSPWGHETLLAGYDAHTEEEEDEWWRVLMDLETDDIPPTADVISATFRAYADDPAANTTGVELRKVTKDWTWQASWSRYDGPENLWENEGGDYSVSLGEVLTAERGSQAGWWEFEVPPQLIEEEAAAEEELPILIKLLDDKVRECGAEHCTDRAVLFDSSEDEEEAHRPYLSVIYDADPVVETKAASEVEEHAATLNASVNPEGQATTYQFEYGPTAAYGSKAPAEPESVGSGTSAVPLSVPLEGLEQATTYHYRIVATNESGTAAGEDMTFTTAAPAPEYQLSFGSKGTANGQFEGVAGVAVDEQGDVWVADKGNDRVQKLSPAGEYLDKLGESGTGNGQLDAPRDVALDAEGNVWIADAGNSRVQKFSPAGEYLDQFGTYGSGDGQFKNPTAIAIAPDGHIWVADGQISRLSEFTAEGEFLQKTTGYSFTQGTAVSADGRAWVTDRGNSRVVAVAEGEQVGEFGTHGEEDGQFKNPTAIDVLPSGALLVGERFGEHRVQELSTAGVYVTQIGKELFGSTIEGIGTDPGGAIYVASGNSVKKWIELDAPIASTEAPSEIGEESAALNATVNPRGLATTYQLEYGETTSYGSEVPAEPEAAGSGTSNLAVSETIAVEEDEEYHYRVLATNSAGTTYGSDEVLSTHAPPQTVIDTPTPSYTAGPPAPIQFSADEAESSFKCGFDTEGNQPTEACESPFEPPEKLDEGWHTFVVAATDPVGNADPTPATWTFKTAPYPVAPETSKLVYPEEGKKTASHYTLKAEWDDASEDGDVAGVTFQMMLPEGEAFVAVPAECTIDGEGQQVSWPLEAEHNPGHTEPVFLDARDCEPFAEAESGYDSKDKIKFRAVFDGDKNVAGASEPVATEFIRRFNGTRVPTDATKTIGPANLDLLTGAFTISRTDVSIPVPGTEANLEFTRVYNSSWPTDPSAVLGWWQPSAPVEQEYEGSAWEKLEEQVVPATPAVYEKECWNEEGEAVPCGTGCNPEFCEEWLAEEAQPEERWIELVDNEGAAVPFEISGENYVSPDYAKELKLTREDATHIVLSDPSGTHTTFIKNSARDYLPKAISFQATPKSARMVYEDPGFEQDLRLMRIIAPSPPGVTCGDWTSIEKAGCRTLRFEYLPRWEWSASGPWFEVLLASIRYYNSSGNVNSSQVVAKYDYDMEGRLVEEWDPRLPDLREKYTYYSSTDPFLRGLLTSLTPPGEEPWEFDYDINEVPEESEEWEARLDSVSRASLLEGEPTATTTIAYDVPSSGEDAPYEMSPEAVAEWGQSDYPVDATAIFPPTQVPGENPPDDYTQATVYYMDPDGYLVNTASAAPPGVEGDAITTSETDTHGNVLRELSAQGRLDSLAHEDPLQRADQLSTKRLYNTDGTELKEEWGPLHEITLESGEAVQARAHTEVFYDEGAPEPKEGETPPHLPTRELAGARIPGQEADKDVRVSETKYDWDLRLPTEEIVDPEGLNLRTKTIYDEDTGLVSETRQPSDPEGKDAGTTVNAYYSAGTQSPISACRNKPQLANLPCTSYPKVDPSPAEGNPKLPWTWTTSYNSLDLPTETQEKVDGEPKRTTTATYDEVGRPLQSHETGEGIEVPPSETLYSSSTGGPVGQRFVCEEECEGFDEQLVITTLDTLGRPTKYEDADGNVSEVAYDLLGRTAITYDGKGTQTATYDEASGALIELEDFAAGTFEAAYDADGKLIEKTLPGGLRATTTYDDAGVPTRLSYAKPGQQEGPEVPDPIAAYSFEEGEGEVLGDSSEGEHDGTISGAAWSEEGKSGSALDFDGEDDVVTVPDHADLDLTDSFTIEAWVRPENLGTIIKPVLSKVDSSASNVGYALRARHINSPAGHVKDSEGALNVTGDDALPVEAWSHLAFTSDGDDLRLYVDGELVETVAAKLPAVTTADLRIGGHGVGSSLYFDGLIDDVRLYEEPLDEAQIRESAGLPSGSCEESCPWLSFEVQESVHGQWLAQQSTLSTQEYAYDAAGRLIGVKDTPDGEGCTTRSYSFDENTNRTKLITREPGEGGACDLESEGTVQDYDYDTGDRLIGEGIEYDDFGRIVELPSEFSGGGKLTTSYYASDLTHSQTQDGITNTYELDATGRQRKRLRTKGEEESTEIYHYAGGSDSPAWIDEGEGQWSRFIQGIGASAIEKSAGEEVTCSSPICTATSSPRQTSTPKPPNCSRPRSSTSTATRSKNWNRTSSSAGLAPSCAAPSCPRE